MEISIKKVDNGYIVRVEGEDPVDGYISKEMVFTKLVQAIRYLKENFTEK